MDSRIKMADAIAQRVVNQVKAEPKAVTYCYSGGVTVADKVNIPFYSVLSHSIHADFIGNFSDIITVEVLIDTRKFYEVVLPNLEHLEVYIRKRQMAENSTLFVKGGENLTTRYKAILHNPPVQGLGGQGQGVVVSNPDQTIQIATFQLIPKDALILRAMKFQAMMPDTLPDEALAMIMSGTAEGYEVEGIQKVEADNKIPCDIIIPNGTMVKDMAHYLQKEYGIYNFGIGMYFTGKHWFIYPLYNNNRYENEFFKMSISVIEKRHEPVGTPRTYVIDRGTLTLISVSETSMVQNTVADQLNRGTGIQVVNPNENRGPNLEVVGVNKVKVDGTVGVSTFNLIDRKDGYNNVINVPAETSNQASLMSSITGNMGNYITIHWNHAKPELIQPGMPVKIHYVDGSLRTLYGTVHEYWATSVRVGETAHVDAPYQCNVVMKIYVTEKPTVKV